MNKVFIILLAFVLFSINANSQQKNAAISFSKTEFNFGTVKEENGNVEIKFEFSNIGAENLIINNVKGDVAISITDWTKTEIAPGAKGLIIASFNPQRNTGRISKSITVFSNSNPSVIVLKVTGTVIPKPLTIADQYPRAIGSLGLRAKNNYFTFGAITNKQTKTDTLKLVNTGTEKLKISFNNVPAYLTLKADKEVLKANEKCNVLITYFPQKNVTTEGKQIWGDQNMRFNLVINDDLVDANRNSITIRATINEDFENLSEEELAKAPKIVFENEDFDFGSVKQGEVVTHDFVFKNNGDNDLEIRHVKGSWGCTAVSKTDGAIKKGESGIISASFNSAGKSNKQQKTITVNTNDPKRQTIILKISGNVTVEPVIKDELKKTEGATGAPEKINTVH